MSKRQNNKPDLASRAVTLRSMSDIQEEEVCWIWENYIPAGMLTELAGAGGSGKSTIAFDFAATISKGGQWPDGSQAKVGRTLIWSGEDSASHTIKPRLMAAGADVNLISMIEGTPDELGNPSPFDPSRDLDRLISEVRRLQEEGKKVDLIIIDPIVSAVSGDMYRSNDVRRSLQPLVDMAKEFGCSVLGITHFAKNTGGNKASDRTLGSTAFKDLARMLLSVAKDEETGRCVLTRAKSNISKDGDGFEYCLEEVHVTAAIKSTRVVWGEAARGSATALLSDVEGVVSPDQGGKQREAEAFLSGYLANGAKSIREVQDAALAEGISLITLRRARTALKIHHEKEKGSMTGTSILSLPKVEE